MTKTIFTICRECDHEWSLEIEFTHPVAAKLYGPPENCYPAEGGDFEILGDIVCPKCNHQIDTDIIENRFWDSLTDDRQDF